ncbi:MAG: adenylate/guanylate cyclase domain-containing protein [Anaerolineales bacterium]
MGSENTTPITFGKQLKILAQRAAGLAKSRAETLANTCQQLAENLNALAAQIEQFEDKYRDLQELARIGQVVNSSLDIQTVLESVMDTIIRITGAERGFLMLREADGEMSIRIARNWEQASLHPSEFAISRTVIRRVVESGEAVLTTNAQEDPRFDSQASIIAFNLRSILCVPLKIKENLIGVIYTDNRVRTGIFTEAERDLLASFANQAAIAIENARLFSSLRQTLAEVTELKNLLDNVFSSITSGVITTNVEEQITLCNRAAERILGRTSAELLGRPLREALAPIFPIIHPHIEIVRRKEQAVLDLELSPQVPGRGAMDWRLNLAPLKDDSDRVQGVAIVLDDLTERKKLEAQRRLLERMVSPAVLEQMDLNSLRIGGKEVELTILFADIRGFTSYSERHTPEELVRVLNQYLAAAADAVLAEEGTVDKFLGDAVMAWFNAPLPQPDHHLRAIRAALRIRQAIHELHQRLPAEAHLSFGVGIHCGPAVLGWIGHEKRLEYTALGDSVNTAKRIQENAGMDQILITRAVYEQVCDRVKAVPFTPLALKGKTQPVEVWEVLDVIK